MMIIKLLRRQATWKLFILLFVLAPHHVWAHELQERLVFNGQIKMLIPTEFTQMDEATRTIKYPDRNAPAEVYTNKETTVNIAFKASPRLHKESSLQGLKKTFTRMFANLNPEISNLSINGVEAFEMYFVSQAIDTDIHNKMVVMSAPDGKKFVFVSFNAIKNQYPLWEKASQEILHSIMFVP